MLHRIIVITAATLISAFTLGALLSSAYMLFMVFTDKMPDIDTQKFTAALDAAIEKGDKQVALNTLTTFPWTHVIAKAPSEEDTLDHPTNEETQPYWQLRFFPPENTQKTRIITIRMHTAKYGDAGLDPNLPESWRADHATAGFHIHTEGCNDTDNPPPCAHIWLSEGFTVIRDNNE